MVFDNFFSCIEDFSFYILSLVFTFEVFRMKSAGKRFRVKSFVYPRGGLFINLFQSTLSPTISRSTLFILRVISTSPSVIVQGSEQGICLVRL